MTEGGRRENEIKTRADRQRQEHIDNMSEMDRLRQEARKLADGWRQEEDGLKKRILQLVKDNASSFGHSGEH